MDDNLLLKIAVLSSIIGMVLLYYSTLQLEAKEVQISDLNDEYLGKIVKVSGAVVSIKNYESASVLKIENSGKIDVFGMNDLFPSELKVGDIISVSGQFKEYRGNQEIIPIKKEDVVILE